MSGFNLNEGDRILEIVFRADGGVDFGPEAPDRPVGYYELWVAAQLLRLKGELMWASQESMRQVKDRAMATSLVRATTIPELETPQPGGRKMIGKLELT